MDAPTTVIDGITYKLELWPVSVAFEWQATLAELGLESIAMAINESKQTWRNLAESDSAMIAKTLLQKIDRASLPKTMAALVANVSRVEKRANGDVDVKITTDYEMRYRGKTMHLYKLAGWVIAENFADFTSAARWLGEVLRAFSQSALKNAHGSDESGDSDPPTQLQESSQPTTPPT